MTPRARWPVPPDGDNTPQGKLAHGCVVGFYWLIALVVLVFLAQWAEHSWCDDNPQRFMCPSRK